MNHFRLIEPCPHQNFINYTGLSEDSVRNPLEQAINKGLITESETHWQVTPLGQRFLNTLLNIFMEQ
jgi:oxygen-independent coproporphyrinogen-3 oxidase